MLGHTAHADDSYYYGGIGAGQSRSDLDVNNLSATLAPGRQLTSLSKGDNDTGYKLFGGYQFTRNFGVEAGYFSLGRFDFGTTDTQGGTFNGVLRPRGVNLDLVFRAPMTEALSIIGRIGAAYSRTTGTFSSSTGVQPPGYTSAAHKVDAKLGGGLEYAFSSSTLLRGELERYRVSDASGGRTSVNLVSLSLVFPFGRSPSSSRAEATSSTPPMAALPTPMPAPEPVANITPLVIAPPAAAPVVLKHLSFSAESLFAFDRSELKPEGREALDQFARETEGLSFEGITVEGHTDRLGTEAYNQSLSQRRADAVKRYLVENGHLDTTKISAVGMGERQPVTDPASCLGKRPTPKLESCLQADRRVEVTVKGTR